MNKSKLSKLIISEIQKIRYLPIQELLKRGDKSINAPFYIGEKTIRFLLDLMLDENWIEPNEEPLLDEIASTLGSLDSNISSEKTWNYLFSLVDELNQLKRPSDAPK